MLYSHSGFFSTTFLGLRLRSGFDDARQRGAHHLAVFEWEVDEAMLRGVVQLVHGAATCPRMARLCV